MREALRRICDFDVIGKGTIQTVYRDNGFVYKVFNASKYGLTPDQIAEDVAEYYESARRSGVIVPEEAVIPYLTDEDVVVNRFSFEGRPFDLEIEASVFSNAYRDLLQNVDRGTKQRIGLSAYHRQYVLGSRGLVFVDFMVPAMRSSYRRYKRGEAAKNYYLLQFSRSSTIVSAYTYYLGKSETHREAIGQIFRDYMASEGVCLFGGQMDINEMEWFADQGALFDQEVSNWLLVRHGEVAGRYDLVEDAVVRADEDDRLIYPRRRRLFTKNEATKMLSEYDND